MFIGATPCFQDHDNQNAGKGQSILWAAIKNSLKLPDYIDFKTGLHRLFDF
jgi:hypothetical protein